MFLEEKKIGEQQIQLEPWQVVMLKAADVIEQRGHCKERLLDFNGNVCLAGALIVADGGDPSSDGLDMGSLADVCYIRMSRWLWKMNKANFSSPIKFNDDPDTTPEMVCAALRNCAKG